MVSCSLFPPESKQSSYHKTLLATSVLQCQEPIYLFHHTDNFPLNHLNSTKGQSEYAAVISFAVCCYFHPVVHKSPQVTRWVIQWMVSSQLHPPHRMLEHLYLPSTSKVRSVLHITDETQHSSAVLCVTVAPPAAVKEADQILSSLKSLLLLVTAIPNVCHLYGIWSLRRKHAGPELR